MYACKILKNFIEMHIVWSRAPKNQFTRAYEIKFAVEIETLFFKEGYNNSLEEICTSVEVRAMQNLKIQL